MGSEIPQVHIFFFPIMAQGHVIPTVDMAKLFATRGVKTTIITTPANASFFSKTIQRSKESGLDVDVKILKDSTEEAGLPEGCENADLLPTSRDEPKDIVSKFFKAKVMLQEPLERLLQECKPDCLVAHMFFPWATDAADKFGIPRLVFYGVSVFSTCAMECMTLYEPHKHVESEFEQFVVPNLPGDIKLSKKQLPDYVKESVETDFTKMLKASKESELRSYGVIFNSFYELEDMYADYYKNVLGRKAWHIGPVSLCNRAIEDKAERGKKSAVDEHECSKWLDSRKPNSVVYVCFGSMANFNSAQLKEIAMGLETSGQQFIWVVRKEKSNAEEEDWLPEGFEKRMEGKGLIIRGWAPQILILDHEAVGGFVTHCGWNSTLEGISAGVPMITWPVSAEQFYNEKFVTEILKIGVAVGVQQWVSTVGDFVKREAIEKAVKKIMNGKTAEELRNKAKALAEMAKGAVAKGGSSYSELNALIEELKLRRH
ncbi:PREDICTED: scopoletin glucosyltransferase [Theobroma cacao]|uniref:Glycosyltransferase n=1 Tax=Theobroma cacao TaxID=3641 RepID=A0AB32VX42_THECC|nr:PREDICTED: scopoletin glucosyltransferase [Theobroma cacao]